MARMPWRSSPPMASRWPRHRPSRSRRRCCASTSSSPRSSTDGEALRRALRRKGLDQQGVERVGALGRAQLLDEAAIAQQARHPRQSLEVIGTRTLGGEQKKNGIDRAIVDRVEIDRMAKPREQAHRLVEAGHAAMRNGNAAADSGRAEPLALQQTVEQPALVEL